MVKRLTCLAVCWATALLLTNNANANEYYMNGGNCCEPVCADSCSDCCLNYSVEVDFLWWDVRRTYPNYSVSEEKSFEIGSLVSNEVKFPNTGYHPGVRVGFYLDDLCQCWDLGIIWTNYESNSHTKAHFDLGDSNSVLNGLQDLKRSIKTDFNCLDIDVSRTFCCNSCFTIRPHFGLRALWIKDSTKTKGFGFVVDDPSEFLLYSAHTQDDNSGVGVEGGLWAECKLWCGLSLVGHFGGSVIRYKDDFHSSSATITALSEEILVDVSEYRSKGSVPSSNQTFEYYLGLQYAFDYCGMDILVKAGWEHFFVNFEYFDFEGLTTGVNVRF